MTTLSENPAVRILPEDVANKIAAGEVVERPASVVKELIENALDAGATRIQVRLVAAGRRLVEVVDNGHGMSEQHAILAIERHATSKVRTADDLDEIHTLGFRGEALPSIAAVSQFELVTRRAKDDAATRVRIDGGVLREVDQVGAPVGTRVTVNRLYFNTPVRAKFLKGITTELSQAIDTVQRHALAQPGVGFALEHNDKVVLDIPAGAGLRERIALIWGMSFVRDMIALEAEHDGYRLGGFIGLPGLTRAARSHQYFFVNRRPVMNRALTFGFEDGYRGLVTVGRHPVGVVLLETAARNADINVHPAKREVRFRDERVVREAMRGRVRAALAEVLDPDAYDESRAAEPEAAAPPAEAPRVWTAPPAPQDVAPPAPGGPPQPATPPSAPREAAGTASVPAQSPPTPESPAPPPRDWSGDVQTEFLEDTAQAAPGVAPGGMYRSVGDLGDAPLQIFDTYLLVPDNERLLIIDQHALHERLNYDSLLQELEARDYESQQLAVPLVFDVAPAQVRLLEKNLDVFKELGIEVESFGGNTFQVVAACHLYAEDQITDLVYRVLDALGQGDLFDREDVMADMLRLATRACKASIRAGDRLTPQERRVLLDGFRRLRAPYTCPHGRPIIVELTQRQMEKSFRRTQ